MISRIWKWLALSPAWSRITNSSAVRLAVLVLIGETIKAASDGTVSAEEGSKFFEHAWLIVAGYWGKTTVEDAALKVGMPPPAVGHPPVIPEWPLGAGSIERRGGNHG